jgi:hypothetical protein
MGVWAGSLSSISLWIYIIANFAPSRHAKLFGMDDTILRALLVPQECTPQNSIFSGLRSAPITEQVIADQQQAFEEVSKSIRFHPGIQPFVLGSDPNMILDDLNSYIFDVDQYLNFDFMV